MAGLTSPDSNLTEVILTVVLAFTILLVGVSVGSSTLEVTDENIDESVGVELEGAGNWVQIDDNQGDEERVVNSRGYAIGLTGANDSYFQSTESVNLASDGTWSVATWAAVDNNSSTSMTALSANGRVVITYNSTRSEWVGWFYDEANRNSYRVNVSANNPNALTSIILVNDGTHLGIYRNNTQGEVKNITASSVSDAPVESGNWDGRVDEVRTFDSALNATQRQQLVDDPVGPLPSADRTGRIMFDEPERGQQRLFFAPGSVRTSNASFVDGLEGQVMDGASFTNNITGDTDYIWDAEGPRIKPVNGGELDGAPIAYVEYSAYSHLDSIADDWSQAILLAGLAPVILILGFIIVQLRSTRR